MKKLFVSATAAATLLSAGSALAETTANLDIEAKVVSSCSVNFKTPNIRFNIAKDNFKGAEQASYFTAQCGNNAVKVALDAGQSQVTDARAMKLKDGVGTIPYVIYQGATGETPWNDKDNVYKVSNVDSLAGKQQTFRVQIPATSVSSQTPNGDYEDHLIATISYEAGA